jgi:antitoxin component HigA of HigAB toxin-antitoxin module
MTETENKRKVKQLERYIDMAERLDTKEYEDDIYKLSNEIEAYENREFDIPRPTPRHLIEFHMERLEIGQKEMAGHLGLKPSYLENIMSGKEKIDMKFKDFIYDFDFHSLNKTA